MSIWHWIKLIFGKTWRRIFADASSPALDPKAREKFFVAYRQARDLFGRVPATPDWFKAHPIVTACFGWIFDSVILGLSGVPLWMALGEVPGWVAGPVMTFWWGWIGLKFVFLGLPFFLVPLWLLWEALRPGRKTPDNEPDREREAEEAAVAEGLKNQSDIKAFGVVPGRIFVITRRSLLLLGLLAIGEYTLGALYIFPNLAEFILNQANRIRAALSGRRTSFDR